MLSAILGLLGAAVYGSADFLGGLAAKRMRSVTVTAIAAASGLVLLLAAYPFLGGAWTPEDVLWGAVSGVFGVFAIVLLYACLAIGPMSILSPLTAVVSAIAPMTWGLLVKGEQLAAVGYAGLGVALVAVVLVGFVPGQAVVRPSLRGILMAIGSGLAIGGFLVSVDQTGDASGVVPLIVNRAVNGAITWIVVGVLVLVAMRRRSTPRPPAPRAAIGLAIAGGLADATANALMLVALRLGDLTIVSVLTAMYPAGTILLAAIVLRERIAPVQWAGLVLALTAGGMLALA